MKPELLPYALAVGEHMAREYITHGHYRPYESWGGEGQIYPSLTGIALLNLFRETKVPLLLEGVKAILASNHRKRMPSGGWALRLAEHGDGIKFKAPQELKDLTADVEDLPPTVTAMRLVGEYILETKDESWLGPLKESCGFLVKFWNEEECAFDEMLHNEAIDLRANPKSYHIYVYQCIITLSKLFPEFEKYITPLYDTIKKVFEGFDEYTYPLLYGMHAALIIETEGNSDYVKLLVKARIEEHITFKSKFIIAKYPGALGHRDGLRGVCLDEGHLRNSVGAAMVMDFYDAYTGGEGYSQTQFYQDLTNWIQSMYEDGLYYEYQDLNDGTRRGVGSPGQYLPVFWILGKF